MPAGFSLAITTSLPPNSRDKGELFTPQHWLSHQPWDLQPLPRRPACYRGGAEPQPPASPSTVTAS